MKHLILIKIQFPKVWFISKYCRNLHMTHFPIWPKVLNFQSCRPFNNLFWMIKMKGWIIDNMCWTFLLQCFSCSVHQLNFFFQSQVYNFFCLSHWLLSTSSSISFTIISTCIIHQSVCHASVSSKVSKPSQSLGSISYICQSLKTAEIFVTFFSHKTFPSLWCLHYNKNNILQMSLTLFLRTVALTLFLKLKNNWKY